MVSNDSLYQKHWVLYQYQFCSMFGTKVTISLLERTDILAAGQDFQISDMIFNAPNQTNQRHFWQCFAS